MQSTVVVEMVEVVVEMEVLEMLVSQLSCLPLSVSPARAPSEAGPPDSILSPPAYTEPLD